MIDVGVFRNTLLTGSPFVLENIDIEDGKWTKKETAREIRLVYRSMPRIEYFFNSKDYSRVKILTARAPCNVFDLWVDSSNGRTKEK